MQQQSIPRSERERQLRELWKTPRGRQQVLERIYRIYPDGVPLPDVDAMITIILNDEFRTSNPSRPWNAGKPR